MSKSVVSRRRPKTDHDPFRDALEVVPLESLAPARLNDAVYKPVYPADPDVRALAGLGPMPLR